MSVSVQIGSRKVGPGQPTFIIAEAGVNHNGDLALAEKLIDIAAASGADAVKFQTFRTEELVSRQAPKAKYQIKNMGTKESQFDMLKKLELSESDHRRLIKRAKAKKILFLSTPFDEPSLDLLLSLSIPALKVSSGDLTNLPLLKKMGKAKLPVVLSSGMGNLGEIEKALTAIGHDQVCLLHCTTNYPAPFNEINLRAMETLSRAFGLPTGYSDHSAGLEVPLAATALGACVIEKHFTVDTSLPGPDHKASLMPEELWAMVEGIRHVELALGSATKRPSANETEIAAIARKSLVLKRAVKKGEAIRKDCVAVKRPGEGIAPEFLESVIGMVATCALAEGAPLKWEHFK